MAMTLAGEIIDPLNGRADLEHNRLTPCSRYTFLNDPLRIFRAFRFAADGWSMAPECGELLRERDWSAEFTGIPVERFSREMLKALAAADPGSFFHLMLEHGLGQGYLPELFRMPQIPAGPPLHHPEGDLLTHSMQVLGRVSAASADPLARFCGFFHDIGKLATDPARYPRHHGHDQAGFGMSLELCRRLRLPARYGTALAQVSRLHGSFNLWGQLRDSTRVRLAEQALKGDVAVILPLVAAADKQGGCEPAEWGEALRIAGMSSADLGVDPQQLEGIRASKRTAHLLQKRVERFRATQTSST
jgi:tRNA nucleotidyltransferase (CCA-adding enzyme)